MSNWKEKRNYWKVKDCHGKVISHIIKIGDQQIEVSEEVFRCYSQGDRRERYILQDQKKSRFLSIEKLIQDEVKENYVGVPCTPSCQDIFTEQEEEAEWSRLKENLLPALLTLNNDDRALITKLFYDGYTQEELAAELGVSQSAISQRRDTVLRRLKKILKKVLK